MTQLRRRLQFRAALLMAFAGLPAAPGEPASATTWIEQAQADLTCTGQADATERLSLDAPWIASPANAASVTSYFKGPPRDVNHAKFRYLTMPAAIGWWADMINDQALPSDVYLPNGAIADPPPTRATAGAGTEGGGPARPPTGAS